MTRLEHSKGNLRLTRSSGRKGGAQGGAKKDIEQKGTL